MSFLLFCHYYYYISNVRVILICRELKEHENIVKYMGICEEPLAIITEFCDCGSLEAYVKKVGMSDAQLVKAAGEIVSGKSQKRLYIYIFSSSSSFFFVILCNVLYSHDAVVSFSSAPVHTGMLFLHECGLIHRDLSARNVFLSKDLVAKVADFGLSKTIAKYSNCYTASEGSDGPVRWLAPECFDKSTFTRATDVWAFGVLLFEVLTQELPYSGRSAVEVAMGLTNGSLKLEFPPNAHNNLAKCGNSCLSRLPASRP